MAQSLYHFAPNMTPIGIGVEGMGFLRPQTVPLVNPYPVRRTIERDMFPYSPAEQVMTYPKVPDISLSGNGGTLQGQMALQNLLDLTKGK